MNKLKIGIFSVLALLLIVLFTNKIHDSSHEIWHLKTLDDQAPEHGLIIPDGYKYLTFVTSKNSSSNREERNFLINWDTTYDTATEFKILRSTSSPSGIEEAVLHGHSH